MKTIIKILFASILIAGVSGCDLERLPYSEVTNEKVDAGNFASITLGTYAKMKEEYYYKSIHYTIEYGGDNISLSGTTTDYFYHLYKYQRLTNNYYLGNLWKFSYQMIVNINDMIERIPEEGSTAEMQQILGENYFLRAFVYFNICNVFGRPYNQSPETNLGIPLKLTSDITDFPPRATVKEVYDQMLKDLNKAVSLMESKKSNIYASKEVAYALLSRIYLYMENWKKAKECADFVINSGRYKLLEGEDFQKYPRRVPESNEETIFAIRMVKDVDFEKYHMASYSVGSMYARINEVGWGEMYPSSSYLELLNQNESDLRRGFIVPQEEENSNKWLIYVREDKESKIFVNTHNKVELQNNQYVIVEKPEEYTSNIVQTEQVDGKTKYYVVRKDDNTKYYVTIENATQLKNGYPMRYIYKCSLQEEQTHLWSPVILRLAEMYLNRAEANYHLGNNSAALDDINVIRERAQIPERVLTDLPPGKSVLDWVLEERRLELAFEAQRKLDIFRNKQVLDRNYPGTHLSGEPKYYTVSPTDDKIVEFIPQRELDAYPIQLVQNP